LLAIHCTLASVADVERILTALGARQELTDELLALARLANTEFQSMRSSLKRGLHQKQRELAALEAYGGQLLFSSGEVQFSSLDLLRKEREGRQRVLR